MSSGQNVGNIHSMTDLGTIAESEAVRVQSSSPEPYVEGTEVNDFGERSAAPRRRSTHPSVPLEPSEPPSSDSLPYEPKKSPIQRAKTIENPSRTHKFQSSRQIFSRRRSADTDFLPQSPRRQSTANTKKSESFEKTAVWDRKAILSLDGGGIRGYSALLIIREIMRVVGKLESSYPHGPDKCDGPADSSYHPLPPAPVIATETGSLSSQVAIEAPKTDSSPWLPCHYFDYMAGTSTGGLISIMLGRLRMNIDDCISDYEIFGDKVFGHSRWFHLRSPLFWPRDKYSHKVLKEVVRDVVKARVPKVASFPGGKNFVFDENRCRVVVLSYQKQSTAGVEKPYLFRTYKNLHRSADPAERSLDRNPALAHDIPIWQVARAASAAPTYFEPLKIDGLEYLDGGFGANNPCVEIYEEVRKMNNNSNSCAAIILSVGTGKNNEMSRFSGSGLFRYMNYLNFSRKWASDSEKTHQDMLSKRKAANYPFEYHRLNVEDGLGPMKLDEWRARGQVRVELGKFIGKLRSPKQSASTSDQVNEKMGTLIESFDAPTVLKIPTWAQPKNKTLDSIKAHTEAYLHKDEVKESIKQCAKILVEGRRLRAKNDPLRWEKACFGAWYQCNVAGCPRGEKEYEDREALKKHIRDKHHTQFTNSPEDREKLQNVLDTCKIVVH